MSERKIRFKIPDPFLQVQKSFSGFVHFTWMSQHFFLTYRRHTMTTNGGVPVCQHRSLSGNRRTARSCSPTSRPRPPSRLRSCPSCRRLRSPFRPSGPWLLPRCPLLPRRCSCSPTSSGWSSEGRRGFPWRWWRRGRRRTSGRRRRTEIRRFRRLRFRKWLIRKSVWNLRK